MWIGKWVQRPGLQRFMKMCSEINGSKKARKDLGKQ